jgi:hypothetical protein
LAVPCTTAQPEVGGRGDGSVPISGPAQPASSEMCRRSCVIVETTGTTPMRAISQGRGLVLLLPPTTVVVLATPYWPCTAPSYHSIQQAPSYSRYESTHFRTLDWEVRCGTGLPRRELTRPAHLRDQPPEKCRKGHCESFPFNCQFIALPLHTRRQTHAQGQHNASVPLRASPAPRVASYRRRPPHYERPHNPTAPGESPPLPCPALPTLLCLFLETLRHEGSQSRNSTATLRRIFGLNSSEIGH